MKRADERSGGEMLVEGLLGAGVERVFCVPGESYLPILDALWEHRARIQTISCRHEHGAAMMAEAYGKLTGLPGVCLVTRGPGASNAAIGVHTARQDGTPMLLLVGQVDRGFLGREAFQEVDLVAMFQPLAKHVEQVTSFEELDEALARALRVATSGRAGPAVLVLPSDLLAERGRRDEATLAADPIVAEPPIPGKHVLALQRALVAAQKPILLLGGGGWSRQARTDIQAFAQNHGLPVACAFRRNDLFDNDHPLYAGELGIAPAPSLVDRVRGADLMLAVGTRLGEVVSQGYRIPGTDGPALIHVHPDATELGRVFAVQLGIAASVGSFAAMAARLPRSDAGGDVEARRRAWCEAARSDYLADSSPDSAASALDLGAAMQALRAALPDDAVVCVDAGNASGWPQRFLRFGGERRLLGPVNGAMGYAVPAAIAAKLAQPQRTVLACAGDGAFAMTGMELATASLYGAAIIVLVFDNAMYGTIRLHQERRYPGRVLGTSLRSPDFAALAAASGAWSAHVGTTAAFAPALQGALNAAEDGRAALLHLICDPDVISTRTTLAALTETRVAVE